MRSYFRRAIVAGSCFALWAGCSAKQQTEYVPGLSTQVSVPRDLKSIVIQISVGGSVQFCQAYAVYQGTVQLPRSLGTYAQNTPNAAGPIQYTIIGLSENFTPESANPIFTTCTGLTVGTNNARLLRRSRQPYIVDEIRFLPMPLKFACVDKSCGDEETCKAGTCVSADVGLDDAKAKFPPYTSDLSDGTGGTCFHVSSFKAPDGTTDVPGCMTAALPAIPVDTDSCVYAVPSTASAPAPINDQKSPFSGPSSGDGVNVQVTFDGLVKEILDSDPEEGFSIPDPVNFPQRFKLAAGLCDMVKGTNGALHQITNIRTSGTCQAKRLAQPLCAADQLAAMGVDPSGKSPDPTAATPHVAKLGASKAALMLVVDDTTVHHFFFEKLAPTVTFDPNNPNQDDAIGKAVHGIVQHPAFATVDVGLVYAPGRSAQACTGTALVPGDIALGSKTAAQVVDDLAGHATTPGPLVTGDVRLAAGLRRAYSELSSQPADKYFKSAALVISNEYANNATCTGVNAATIAGQAKAGAPTIPTFAIQIVKAPDLTSPGAATDISALSVAGAPTGEANDYGYQVAGAVTKFGQVLADLATCTYDVAADALPTGATDVLTYDDLQTGDTVTLKSTDFTVDTMKNRVIMSDAACTAYRKVFAASTLLNFQLYGAPAAANVPVFARTFK